NCPSPAKTMASGGAGGTYAVTWRPPSYAKVSVTSSPATGWTSALDTSSGITALRIFVGGAQMGSGIGPLRPAEVDPMGRLAAGALYVVAMAAVVVGVDVAFFRNNFWERLAANVGIVLVFVAFYFRFLHRP